MVQIRDVMHEHVTQFAPQDLLGFSYTKLRVFWQKVILHINNFDISLVPFSEFLQMKQWNDVKILITFIFHYKKQTNNQTNKNKQQTNKQTNIKTKQNKTKQNKTKTVVWQM